MQISRKQDCVQRIRNLNARVAVRNTAREEKSLVKYMYYSSMESKQCYPDLSKIVDNKIIHYFSTLFKFIALDSEYVGSIFLYKYKRRI